MLPHPATQAIDLASAGLVDTRQATDWKKGSVSLVGLDGARRGPLFVDE
jgi:hypothetical protein